MTNLGLRTAAAGVTAAAALAGAASSNAAIVTDEFKFTSSGYTDVTGTESAPVDPVNGDFLVTFDPTQVTFLTNGNDITVKSLSGPFDGNIIFSNNPGVGGDFELIDGAAGSNFTLQWVGNFNAQYGRYTFDGGNNIFVSSNQDLTVAPVSVPEPATWALMLTGLAAAGIAARSRRRVAPAAVNAL